MHKGLELHPDMNEDNLDFYIQLNLSLIVPELGRSSSSSEYDSQTGEKDTAGVTPGAEADTIFLIEIENIQKTTLKTK